MANDATPTWLAILGVVVGVGFLLALPASLPDLMCLDGFDAIAGTGKGTAFIKGALFALGQPGLLFPVFAGFALLTFLCLLVPHLFADGTLGRQIGALLILPLLLLGVLWAVVLAPAMPCDVWAGMQNLKVIGAATLLALAALVLLR